MNSGLIIPGKDPRRDVRQLVTLHNQAMGSLGQVQADAVNRIILASAIVRSMVGDNAPADVQQHAAQEALAEVIRREANGQKLDMVMWRKPLVVTDSQLDILVDKTRDGG